MRKAKTEGVKGLSRNELAGAAVEVIANQRMAKVSHVDADLMRAPCLKDQMDKGKIVIGLYGVVVCPGFFALRGDFAQDDAR